MVYDWTSTFPTPSALTFVKTQEAPQRFSRRVNIIPLFRRYDIERVEHLPFSGHGALLGSYSEVSCSEWSGSDGSSEFTGACLSGQTAGFWPSVGCGNKGELLTFSKSEAYNNMPRRDCTILKQAMLSVCRNLLE